MDIREIINELTVKQIISDTSIQVVPLSGGTSSEVFLLLERDHHRFVVKLNEETVLSAEAGFLQNYQSVKHFPDLVYQDPANRYIVYTFLQGSTNYTRRHKKKMLKILVHEAINHYKKEEDHAKWGWLGEEKDSWRAFLHGRIEETSGLLQGFLSVEDIQYVRGLVDQPERYSYLDAPFLIHGDCGVHNFLFNDGDLSGVIDPTPIYGDPLYDLIYAFCSSPDDLSRETIECAAAELNGYHAICGHFLYGEVLIGLFLRMGTCLIHHPNDLEEYMVAWKYWKNACQDG
ncbi:phosphotransferase family protein [Falsibacillus albus]|uniref:Aminoglycoside phosphotransferase family protein n=1 Tax=Falsibacillus albus TaxID=2478915 RepID=A0A3L7JSJ5_9BACI|nr:phosphotransferase [Falsibacillus albus]RLQ93294.1 aminoglycoside phosphotransferase family protein [Falsibacillus albus]